MESSDWTKTIQSKELVKSAKNEGGIRKEFQEQELENVIGWMLPGFHMVKNNNTITAISAACISLLANAIKRKGEVNWQEKLDDKLKSWNLITGPETYDELRLNLLVVGEPGSGKSSILGGFKELNPYTVSTSQSQPNFYQLIGSTEKWREGDEWHYNPTPGIMSKDVVVMDEALSIYTINTGENQKIREVMRGALTRIGGNMIGNPQVRVPEDFQCNYYPECTLIQGFPARRVPIALVTEGDIRRSQIIPVNMPLQDKESSDRFGTESPMTEDRRREQKKDAKMATEYLRYLRSKKYNIWIPKSTMEYVKQSMSQMKTYAQAQGMKAGWTFKVAYFDYESQLLRYGIVRSIIRDAERDIFEVSVDDIKKSFSFFSGIFADALVWINKCTTDEEYTLMPVKGRDSEKTIKCLDYLADNGAYSFAETDSTATAFKKYMVTKGWFQNEAGTKAFYQELRKYGIIRTRKKGREWVVWIGPTGREFIDQHVRGDDE